MGVPDRNVEWLERVRRRQHKQDAKFSETRQLDLEKYRAVCLTRTQSLLLDPEIRIRCYESELLDFLTDGVWKSAFAQPGLKPETHMEERRLVERDVLGVAVETAPEDRPAYGYLAGSNESNGRLLQYGPYVLHVDAERHDVTSVCMGDSFTNTFGGDDPTMIAAPLLLPDLECRQAERDVLFGPPLWQAVPETHEYAEVQIFDRLRPSHISFATITGGEQASPEVARALDDAGIPLNESDGDAP